jgi:hypothetical protein
MSKDIQEKAKVEFQFAINQRNFEIDLFWKRSWFFGALILAEVAGFYQLKTAPILFFPTSIIAFITTLTVLFQCLMNRGSKYWQERWEYITMNREAALGIELTKLKVKMGHEHFDTNPTIDLKDEWYYIDASILAKDKNIFAQSRRFSVSKITFLVWDIIFICTFLCWLNESIQIFSVNPDWEFTISIVVFYILVCGYIFLFWKKGNVYEHYSKDFASLTSNELAEINQKYVTNKFF